MRAALLLLLAAIVAVPTLAAAQEPARPVLAVEPAFREAPAGGTTNVTLAVKNPLATPLLLTLSAETTTGARIAFERVEVRAPPKEITRVNVTVALPADAVNVTHSILFRAREPNGTLALDAKLQVRALPPRLDAAPLLELRIEPQALDVPAGGEARAVLVVRNRGPEVERPDFEARLPPGVAFALVAPPPTLPRGESRHDVVLRAQEDAPRGGAPDASIGLRNARSAPARFALHVAAPAPPASAPVSAPASAPDASLIAAGAIAGAAGAWTIAWLTRHKWWPLLAALYTRLRPSKLLDHPVRAKIVEVVLAQPGITFSDLARAVGIAPGQLTHHARMLEKAGIVFSSPDGQTRRFFHVAAGRLAPVAPLAERALALVRERAPLRASDAARELGVSRQALHYHVKQLAAQGRLRTRAEGRDVWLDVPMPEGSSTAAGVARS